MPCYRFLLEEVEPHRSGLLEVERVWLYYPEGEVVSKDFLPQSFAQ